MGRILTIGIDASRANVAERTGTEWYIFNLIQELKGIIPASGYRVILYTKEPLRSDLTDLPAHWHSQVLRWPPRLLWTQLRLSITMLKWWSRPDILFIPAHTIPIIHPQRTIYVAHDLGFEHYPELYSNTYIGGRAMNSLIRLISLGKYGTHELDYHRWSMRFAAKYATKIIAISQFTKTELQKIYHTPAEKISVVYNGFTAQDYHPIHAGAPVKPYLLFVGRIEHKKNLVNLVKAFGLLKQHYHLPHQLVLAGFPGYGYEAIQAAIKQQHLSADIMVRGYVPQADMATLMSQAAAFIFPSHYEGFGIPILEALATNILVICSDIPPLHEVGGQAVSYFNQHDPVAMAKVIAATLQLPAEQQNRVRSLGKAQVQQFSWRRCALQTWQVITTTLEPV